MHYIKIGTAPIPQFNQRLTRPIQARQAYLELPGGSYDQDGGGIYLRSPQITINCEVVNSDIDDTLDALEAELFRGRRILTGVMRNGYEHRHTWAKLISVQRSRRPGTKGHQPLDITLLQDYPYWLATEDEPIYFDDGRFFDDGEFFDGGHREIWTLTTAAPFTQNNTISNGGNAPVPRGLIVVEPEAASSITNLRITNDNDLSYIEYIGTVSAGSWLSIDLLNKAALHDGDNAYNDIERSSTNLDWMLLYRGDNSISLSADDVTGTVKIYWQWARHYP